MIKWVYLRYSKPYILLFLFGVNNKKFALKKSILSSNFVNKFNKFKNLKFLYNYVVYK